MPNAVAAVLLSAVIAVCVLGLSIIGFFMLWHIGAKGGHASFSGMVMALMVLIPVGLAASRYRHSCRAFTTSPPTLQIRRNGLSHQDFPLLDPAVRW
jgi:membrane protein YdbS with pleckstrin-like domain